MVDLQTILKFIENPAIRVFRPKSWFAATEKLERVELLPVTDILSFENLVIDDPLDLCLGFIPNLIAVFILIDLSVRKRHESGDVLPILVQQGGMARKYDLP